MAFQKIGFDTEYNGVGFVEISTIFVVKDDFFLEKLPFCRFWAFGAKLMDFITHTTRSSPTGVS